MVMQTNSKSVRVGAIWNKVSKNDNPYLSINIDVAELLKCLGYEPPAEKMSIQLAAFQNNKKEPGGSSPDYGINFFLK
jgi:uncharacterized protein (DUF736 family)